jgi:hypothetical protein
LARFHLSGYGVNQDLVVRGRKTERGISLLHRLYLGVEYCLVKLPIQLIVLLAVLSGSTDRQAAVNVFKVSGVVQYPDGKPAAGATVTGVTACEREPYHLSQETTSAADGSFNLQFVNSECSRIRLGASKIDEFWLKTGMDIFYPKENGTAPIIEGTEMVPTKEAVIRLGERGGLVQSDYIAASSVHETLKVEAGQRIAKDVTLDVRKIKPVSSHNNPRGKPCAPSLH